MGIFDIFTGKEEMEEEVVEVEGVEVVKKSVDKIVIFSAGDYSKESKKITEYLKTTDIIFLDLSSDMVEKEQYLNYISGATSMNDSQLYKLRDDFYVVLSNRIKFEQVDSRKK